MSRNGERSEEAKCRGPGTSTGTLGKRAEETSSLILPRPCLQMVQIAAERRGAAERNRPKLAKGEMARQHWRLAIHLSPSTSKRGRTTTFTPSLDQSSSSCPHRSRSRCASLFRVQSSEGRSASATMDGNMIGRVSSVAGNLRISKMRCEHYYYSFISLPV